MKSSIAIKPKDTLYALQYTRTNVKAFKRIFGKKSLTETGYEFPTGLNLHLKGRTIHIEPYDWVVWTKQLDGDCAAFAVCNENMEAIFKFSKAPVIDV